MKLRNILFFATALPSFIYGIGLDFSKSLKPSVPEIQIETYNVTEEAVEIPKKEKRFSLKYRRDSDEIDCRQIAIDYVQEKYPDLEFQVSSIIETKGFYITTVNLEQSKYNRVINNAFVNVNVDNRNGDIYSANLEVWDNAVFDEMKEFTESKIQKLLKESLIDLNKHFNLKEDVTEAEWDDMSFIRSTNETYIVNDAPFSPGHSVVAKLIVTVKKGKNEAYGIFAWEFTIFYNGVYNIISYDYQRKKPINGLKNQSKIKYVTYPFSKFKDYKIQVSSNLDNTLSFSPYGWHKISEDIKSYVTLGNNIRAQDYATKETFYGGENLEFVGCEDIGCNYVKEMYNKDVTLTTMFYIGNILHDIYYNLGFDEKKGNFQEYNFEKGGRGNDAMIFEAYIDECTKDQKKKDELCDYAYPYTTSYVDGVPPVIYFPKVDNSKTNSGKVSSGLINHVIIHEYTHGVTGRLSGGPNYDCGLVDSVLDFAALNEGYSDFFSAAFQFNKDKKIDRKADYILDQINNRNNIINLSSNYTYSYLKIMTTIESGQYEGANVWRTMLYDAFINIVEEYPSSITDDYLQIFKEDSIPKNVLFLKIILEGVRMAGCNQTFLRARDHIILAAKKNKYTENDTKFQCLIWKAFADRGLGVNAVEPVINGKKSEDQIYLYKDNFDLPEECIEILK